MDDVLCSSPNYKLNFPKKVQCIELSPYEWSQQLICIALGEEIIVATIKFQEDDDSDEDITYNPLRTFHHETRVHALAWSPETSLSVVPRNVTFAVAGADFKIRQYQSDLNETNEYESLEGHKDYINMIAYDPEGELLASVSDDHTCKLWAIKEEQKACMLTFWLSSCGVSVCWHTEECSKLLVAELNGLIQMYNVRSQQAIMSVEADSTPLYSAAWSLNPLKVACIASRDIFLWDVSRPSRPVKIQNVYTEGGKVIKFSPSNENLIATMSRPDNILKVINLKDKQTIFCGKVVLYGTISWHQHLPIVCAGSDRNLYFWKINSK